MLNPDYIPPEIGWPVAAFLWLLLFAMILWDRRKLNKLVKSQESNNVNNNIVPLNSRPYVRYSDGKPTQTNYATNPPQTRRETRTHKPVSNFYDQEQDKEG